MDFIVKITTKLNIFDLIAPHTCRGCGHIGEAFCDRCKKNLKNSHQNYCPNCKTNNTNGKCKKCKNLPPIFNVGDRNSIIGALIKDYKYNSVRALSKPLAELLDNALPIINQPVTIIPLPTIDSHIRQRGLDHTYLLAKQLSKRHHNWSVKKAIIRANNSIQVGSDKKTRLTQANLAYSINPKFKPENNITYLLLDDVWTTGASIRAGIKILKENNINDIVVGILAVSRLD